MISQSLDFVYGYLVKVVTVPVPKNERKIWSSVQDPGFVYSLYFVRTQTPSSSSSTIVR